MRVILRRERPHPGAQLRITDVDGMRITAFATNSTRGELADLELRHRHRARAEDRIRVTKDTGLTNLPLHDFTQNQIWWAIVALAAELVAWMQTLALAEHPARRWEPKRLRLRLFSIAGRLTRTGRRTVLHLSRHAPWVDLLTTAITALRALPAPGGTAAHRPPDPPHNREWKPAPTRDDTGRPATPRRQNHHPRREPSPPNPWAAASRKIRATASDAIKPM